MTGNVLLDGHRKCVVVITVIFFCAREEGVDCYTILTQNVVVRHNTKYRSELEASYAKGLAKLASKLLKTTGELQGPHGTVTAGWSAVAMKMESEAELHK